MLGFLTAATVLPVPFINWNSMSVPGPGYVLLILFLGTVSFVAQYCLTQAYRLERAGVVAMTRYVGVLFHLLLGYFIWFELPSLEGLVGGVFILLASLKLSQLLKRETSST